jgi:hypothetical protein
MRARPYFGGVDFRMRCEKQHDHWKKSFDIVEAFVTWLELLGVSTRFRTPRSLYTEYECTASNEQNGHPSPLHQEHNSRYSR